MKNRQHFVEHEGGVLALELDTVSVHFGERTALDKVSLTLQRGELLALLGQNGAGKSTLARTVTGAVSASAGTVRVLGTSPARARRRGHIAVVPQRDAIPSDAPMSLVQLVASGLARHLGPFRRLAPRHRDVIDRELARLELTGLERRLVGELSGGQLRRALLARALVQDAPLILLDEPFAGVDTHSADVIRGRLAELRRTGCAILLITHGTDGLEGLADELVLLRGHVIDRGPVKELATPESLARLFEPESTVPTNAQQSVTHYPTPLEPRTADVDAGPREHTARGAEASQPHNTPFS